MFKPFLISIICAGALAVPATLGQTAVDRKLHAKSEGTERNVDVKSVVKVFLATDTPGYAIDYEYDFPQLRSVYIKGFGTVPAKGSFRYLTADTQLEFRDRSEGQVLVRVPLEETVIVAAKAPLLTTPDIKDFPDDARTFNWESPKSLQERADTVLNKYFHLAPRNDCDSGMVQIRTTYTPLELKNAPTGVTAQVALLLSLPCEPKSDRFSFQVRSRVMEGRTHSDEFHPTKDWDLVHASDSFVNSLVTQMKTGERGNQ